MVNNLEADFWHQSAKRVLASVEADPRGLSKEEATRRLAAFGPNRIAQRLRKSIVRDLARRLANPLVAILLVASAIAGFTGDSVSFAIIVAVVMLSTGLDLVQERRAQATAEALKRSIALTAAVTRDGEHVDLPVEELVPGDIVSLVAGDLVPADGLVLSANAAQVNQAALTGEPYPVSKRNESSAATEIGAATNVMLNGSSVVAGSATMLVVATGARTQLGRIAGSLAQDQPPTAFERGLHRLGFVIVRLTVFLVLFVLLTHLALGRPALESFLFAMALAVGLTPELLPMIVTVALARGALRMARGKVVVKRLSAIHDLGQMDVLCTDKTGTLTLAQIAMVAHPGIDGADSERVAELAAVNARFETGLKSPLDDALLNHLATPRFDDWKKIDEYPFDFERRRVSVLAEKAGVRIEIVKGAPETILSLCAQAEQRDGSLLPLDSQLLLDLKSLHDRNAAEGLRMLGVAWKPAPGREYIEKDDEAGLIFSGLCVFIDPPKETATSAIARLEDAGVRIKVISGDAGVVIQHLVTELRLPVTGVLTGAEINSLSDEALAARVDATDLYARVTPDQKLRIVRALQSRGHTVGFIGDGINDAPAIRAGDVGLSVDGATDVAREAADMILLAPDLNVLADGVAEGRRTYANIMKYIRMGTSSNFGNMLTMALASVFLPFLPLTAVQVLLNNMLYDLSQIGIPFDRADPSDATQPRGWDMRALVRFTFIMGPLSSLFDIATMLALVQVFRADVPVFRAAWFVESMATQILVVFVIRTRGPCWRSPPDRALTISAIACLCLALTLPFLPLADTLGFKAPGMPIMAFIALLVVMYLAASELLKKVALKSEAPVTSFDQSPALEKPIPSLVDTSS